MEDKIFELMEKMYADLKGELTDIKRVLDMKADKTDIIRLEDEHGKKLDTLFDGYKQLAEGQEEIKSQLTELSAKAEKQDIRINALNVRAVK
jgi:ABC-type enterochelin transport system substrate-binding protein